MCIRILLADDHRIFCEALWKLLSEVPGIAIIAATSTGRETLAMVARELPDVLVLDIALPDMSGIEVARQVVECHPAVRVIALSGYADKVFVNEMLKAGALGYCVKSSGVAVLVSAIHAVMAGHRFLSPETASVMLNHLGPAAMPVAPPVTVLTRREQEILRLLADGRRSVDIAAELAISPLTVDVHRRNIKRKLGLNSIAELTRYAIREGLIVSD